MQTTGETIAAIATAPGPAAIAIVRVSGPASLSIADGLVRCRGLLPSQRPANSFVRGFVQRVGTDPGGTEGSGDLDEVILLVYRAPHSYTREDMVEIQGHGGSTAARRILRAVLGAGARLAEPGEFTRLAFLNGRIDLLQCEAVLDLIRAHSDRAAAAALDQLEGRLSEVVDKVYDELLAVSTDLEASLDFLEGEEPPGLIPNAVTALCRVQAEVEPLLQGWNEGRLLREGAMIVISGKPNVGKSTLLNCLLGSERAIVTPYPGTTRDIIEESVVLGGIPLRLVDTAGLHDAECAIEQEGIRRARGAIERADLNLLVLDGSVPVASDERRRLCELDPDRSAVVVNKMDLGCAVGDEDFGRLAVVEASLRNRSGVDKIKQLILDKLDVNITSPAHAVISERHRDLLVRAQADIGRARCLLGAGRPESVSLAASDIRSALEALGLMTGRVYFDELLDSVFTRFCVGK